jgi:Tfp pilus assembly protein PilN
MINLLPPEHANAIRYGRHNTILRKWLIGVAIALAGLVVILAGGWAYLNQESTKLQKNIDATNKQLQTQNLAQVQKDAKEITGDISVINKVLSQEIRFSALIQAIGNVMPPGTTLGSLSLSNKVSGAIDFTVNAKDYTSVAQTSVNLSDPNNVIFSKVDIVQVNCTSATTTPYRCTATMRALFSPKAQTKFLNAATGSNQ